MRPSAFLLLILFGLCGCQSTQIAPVADATAHLEPDERRLWIRASEEQETLNRSGFLVVKPEVETYLNDLLGRFQTVPLGEGGRLYVHVLADPTLNAFVLPNGAMYIHTGMLACLQNEAQLAAILSHELIHATHRHALRGFRQLKNQTGFLASFTAGTGGAGALLGTIGALSAISGYSRDLEREADERGFKLFTAAGYDPRECTKVFQMLLTESQRSKIKEPFFFGSHPRLKERIASFEQLVTSLPPGQRQGLTGDESYTAVMAPIFLLNAGVAARAGDHDFACASAERYLRIHADEPQALLIIADSRRKRAGADDAAEALRLYRQITEQHVDFPDAYSGLGLMLFKQGDKPAAATAFHRYLELKPNAADRTFIENYLLQCEI